MYSPRTFIWLFFLGAALTVLTASVPARAQGISVTPVSWDFGNVQVGDSASIIFHIESLDLFTPLTIVDITIENDPLSAFAITHLDPIPPEMRFTDDPVDVEVTFSPPGLDLYDGALQVKSNDIHNFPPDGPVMRPLSGTGVPIPEPASASMLALGLAGLAYGGWRLRRSGEFVRACSAAL